MLDDKPLIEHTYIQTRSKIEYKVVAIGKIKCPESGYWYDAIFYVCADNTPGFYGRTVQSFMSNFEDTENIVEI